MSVKWMATSGFLLLLATSGCGKDFEPGEYTVASVLTAAVPAKSPIADEAPSGEMKTARRVIREAELRFETTDRNVTRTESSVLSKRTMGIWQMIVNSEIRIHSNTR